MAGSTYPQLAVVHDSILIIFLDIVWEVVNGDVIVVDVFHYLEQVVSLGLDPMRNPHTLFLKALSSLGVKESALPMTGMTLTRGDKRRINSMSISLKL